MSKSRSLPDQLEIKAGMIEDGEHIQYGSEIQLMRLAAHKIRALDNKNIVLLETLKQVAFDLEAFIEGGYWPNAHISLENLKILIQIKE